MIPLQPISNPFNNLSSEPGITEKLEIFNFSYKLYVESLTPSIGISCHYWATGGFFRDLIPETLKVFLHDMGIYKRINCACHVLDKNGKRVKRG